MLYESIDTIFSKVPKDRDGEQIRGCQGLVEGEMGVTANRYWVSFWSDANVLGSIVVMVS